MAPWRGEAALIRSQVMDLLRKSCARASAHIHIDQLGSKVDRIDRGADCISVKGNPYIS